VIDQLDLGNGLVAVQLHEIPSDIEIAEALYHEPEAIQFWKDLSNEKFEVPLEKFCEEVLVRMRLPIVKKITPGRVLTHIQLEAYQKYWSLWIFAGGDELTFSTYLKGEEPPKSECLISFQRFGMLLTWFGHFGKFLNEILAASQLKMFYEDQLNSGLATSLLRRYANNKDYDWKSDLWLIRLSNRRDHPFVISYIKPPQGYTDQNPPAQPYVNHSRIMFNPASRKYFFSNGGTSIDRESISELLVMMQIQFNLGKGIPNVKFDNINEPHQEQRDSYTPIV
jgi:hypothetical protein